LDGAAGLAIPLRFGQSLHLRPHDGEHLIWTSLEADGSPWFQGTFHPGTGLLMESTDQEVGIMLEKLLRAAPESARRNILKSQHLRIQADFNRDWGLGSSATLVWLVASLLKTSPYPLLDASFGGSGYDLACAAASGPIVYQRNQGKPSSIPVALPEPILNHLFFVYSGKKQNSRDAIHKYRTQKDSASFSEEMNQLSLNLTKARTVDAFGECLQKIEEKVRNHLMLYSLKDYHPDYPGILKPMGAWGGDFFLAFGPPEDTRNYFESKGFFPVWQAKEVMLNY
jgi:mevalonate kinase